MSRRPAAASAQAGPDARRRVGIELWRLALPVLWFGLIAAISFIEAPLKFQAPGITIPLGLGIGRLVFAALNVAEGLVLLTLTLLSFWPLATRISGARFGIWAGLAAVYVAKITLVRPPLNARTDLVLDGADPGQSIWHYVYIGCDLATMILLALAAAGAAGALLPPRTAPGGAPARRSRR